MGSPQHDIIWSSPGLGPHTLLPPCHAAGILGGACVSMYVCVCVLLEAVNQDCSGQHYWHICAGCLFVAGVGVEGCPVHCGIFHSIPGSYLLAASSTPYQVVTAKNNSSHFQKPPGAKSPPVVNHWHKLSETNGDPFLLKAGERIQKGNKIQ